MAVGYKLRVNNVIPSPVTTTFISQLYDLTGFNGFALAINAVSLSGANANFNISITDGITSIVVIGSESFVAGNLPFTHYYYVDNPNATLFVVVNIGGTTPSLVENSFLLGY